MSDTEHIREWLREVYDPELGINIVDLGLVYDIREAPDRIVVTMTLTTPGCPLHDAIVGGVERALAGRSDNRRVQVNIVWEPEWSPHHMSDAAKAQLGFL